MKKAHLVIAKILLIVVGWFIIQIFVDSVPFGTEDLTLAYYLTKIFIQSAYVMLSVYLVTTSLDGLTKQDSTENA